MKDSIDDFLNLDLVEYAYRSGYTELKSGKESTTWVSLKNPSTGDHVRIKRKPLPMVFNNNDANLLQDRGNIINFVINRLDGFVMENPRPEKHLFGAAFNILKKETGDFEVKLEFTKSDNLELKDYVKSKLKNLEDCSDYSSNYLKNIRNIEPSILNNVLFAGKIKESPVKMANGKIIRNLCFLKTDLNNNITGIVTHYKSAKDNTNIKRVYELKDNIWISNRINNPKNLIYGESAVDCLSHYEMINSKNAVYGSLEGEASTEKIEKLYELYQNLGENSTITSITDNDYNGNNYDLKIALYFYNKNHFENPIERVQEQNNIKYIIHNELKDIDLVDLKNKMERIIKLEAPTNHQLFTPYLNLVKLKDKTIISVPYKDNTIKISHFLKPLIESIHKANNINYYSHKSKKKDWNEDLQESKKKDYNKLLIRNKI